MLPSATRTLRTRTGGQLMSFATAFTEPKPSAGRLKATVLLGEHVLVHRYVPVTNATHGLPDLGR